MGHLENETKRMNEAATEIAAAIGKSIAQLLPAICKKFSLDERVALLAIEKAGTKLTAEVIALMVRLSPEDKRDLETQLGAIAQNTLVEHAVALQDDPNNLLTWAKLDGLSDEDLADLRELLDRNQQSPDAG